MLFRSNGAATDALKGWWSFNVQIPLPVAFNKSAPANGAVAVVATTQALSWAASTGAVSYEYCIDTINNNTCDGTWTTTGTNRSIVPPGLLNATTYYWQVRALNIAGTTEANGTTWWAFTTRAGSFNKTAPANGATNIALTRILSWGTSAGATSYEYCYDTTNNNTCNGTWTSTGTTRTATVSGLNVNTLYYWHVRSVYAGGYTYANNNAWWSFRTIP